MKKIKWFGYSFADGTYTICARLKTTDMKKMVAKHGKLLSEEYLYEC